MREHTPSAGSFIVSWDFSPGKDHDIFLVGKQENGTVTVINAFLDEDARAMYRMLSTVKKKEAKR